MHGIKSECQGSHEPVVRDELTLLRQQRQHGFHILFCALDGNVLCVLTALVFRKLLLQKVRQVVLKAVLLEIRAGNARGIILRTQIIDFFQFCAIVVSDDGSGIADLGVRHRGFKVRRQRSGCQCQSQAQRRSAEG